MSVIENDIRRWSREKLSQWVTDSMDRYEMADISESTASANMVQDLWVMAACFLVESNANYVEAGIAFGHVLKAMRSKARDQNRGVSES